MEDASSDVLFYEDCLVGRELDTPWRTVTHEDILSFANLTGDHNPIHVDPDFAAATQFGRPVAHGLLGIGVVLGLIHEAGFFDGSGIALLDIDQWEFRRALVAGEAVHARIRIVSRRRSRSKSSQGIVARELSLVDSSGEALQSGVSRMLIRVRDPEDVSLDPMTGDLPIQRLPFVDLFDSAQQGALSGALRGLDGEPLNLFKVLVHHPDLLSRINSFGSGLSNRGILDDFVRELVILRVAFRCRCMYEFAHHARIGQTVGLTTDDIRGVQDRSVPSDVRSYLFRLVDSLVDGSSLSEELFANVLAEHGPQGVLELVAVIGYYRMLADIIRWVGVPLDAEVDITETEAFVREAW